MKGTIQPTVSHSNTTHSQAKPQNRNHQTESRPSATPVVTFNDLPDLLVSASNCEYTNYAETLSAAPTFAHWMKQVHIFEDGLLDHASLMP
jgi:hypothetical protein